MEGIGQGVVAQCAHLQGALKCGMSASRCVEQNDIDSVVARNYERKLGVQNIRLGGIFGDVLQINRSVGLKDMVLRVFELNEKYQFPLAPSLSEFDAVNLDLDACMETLRTGELPARDPSGPEERSRIVGGKPLLERDGCECWIES